jgi:hypothetical protein
MEIFDKLCGSQQISLSAAKRGRGGADFQNSPLRSLRDTFSPLGRGEGTIPELSTT